MSRAYALGVYVFFHPIAAVIQHTAVHSPIKRHVLILYDKPEQCIRIRRIISGAGDDGVLREVKLLPKQLPHRLLRFGYGQI